MPGAMNHDRRSFVGALAMTLAAAHTGATRPGVAQSGAAVRLGEEGPMPSLDGSTGWLNSQPLNADNLRGKVVLVDFWTYTCVNWRRTLPYVRAWAAKYKDHGLIVVGVHTPEFSFEHDVDNVRWAIKDMKIDYPVAIDSDYTIWNAFSNEYWPAEYFVDPKGRIRHHQFGEGDYAQSERVIQQLLAEAGATGFTRELVSVVPCGAEVAANLSTLRSPETYTGYGQTENFASPGGAARNTARIYAAPERLELNHWALIGEWTVGKEAVMPKEPGGRIAFCFHARDLNLVMGPAARGTSATFRVLIDGRPPGTAHGIDVNEQGNGRLVEQRLYQLVRQPGPIVDRRFEIEFPDANPEAFDFTFG